MYGRKNAQRGLWVVWTLVVTSCAQIVGMEEGVLREEPSPECVVIDDCQAFASECRTPQACTNGKCIFENVIRGTRLSAQTIGDCKDIVCAGDGSTELVVADIDIEDDGNDCTADACNAGKPVHTPVPGQFVACYEGPAETREVGICKHGTQLCDELGNRTGPCENQVLPQAEVCDTSPVDENCNGAINETGIEGGTCSCGDGAFSPAIGEVCEDGNLIGGDGCSPLCSTVQVEQLAVGGLFACIRLNNGGAVKCWGHNATGELGNGTVFNRGDDPGEMGMNLAEAPLGTGKFATDVGLGQASICAILNDGTLRCWGNNVRGQLGEGTATNRGDAAGEMGDAMPVIDLGLNQVPKNVAGGVGHTCALMTNGDVKCWGANDVGQLGLGDTKSRGTMSTDMGENLPKVNLGIGRTAKAIALGGNFSCAILDDDNIKCWGANAFGQLGLGDVVDRGVTSADMGDNLPKVDLGTGKTAKRLAAGLTHACAIMNDDTVKCWGQNGAGQLGLGNTENRGGGQNEMGDNLPTIDLGAGRIAVSIALGAETTCVILDDGGLKCWGRNDSGQLGTGDSENRGDAIGEVGDALVPINLGTGRKAKSIHLGEGFACALLDDTSVKCWGHNGEGRLGYGDSVPRGGMPNEMGDNLPIVKLFADSW